MQHKRYQAFIVEKVIQIEAKLLTARKRNQLNT